MEDNKKFSEYDLSILKDFTATRMGIALMMMFQKEEEMEEYDEYETEPNTLRNRIEKLTDKFYTKVRDGMRIVYEVEGDDGEGKCPSQIEEELFECPASLMYSEMDFAQFDRFDLVECTEIWILANGRIAIVGLQDITVGEVNIQHRRIKSYAENNERLSISFCDFEDQLLSEMSDE